MKLIKVSILLSAVVIAHSGIANADTIDPKPLVNQFECLTTGAMSRYAIVIVPGTSGRAQITVIPKHGPLTHYFRLRGFGDETEVVGQLISHENGNEEVIVGTISAAEEKPGHLIGSLTVQSLNGGKPMPISCTLYRLPLRTPAQPDSEPAIK